MEIVCVVAMAKNRVIGHANGLPWHLPGDLKHFKRVTGRHPMVMGRKTFDSIGRALPDRRNIVVSRGGGVDAAGIERAGSLDQAIGMCRDAGADTVMVIGGGEIFRQALDAGLVDRIELTEIHTEVDGDVLFPELDDADWQETARAPQPPETPDGPAYDFVTLVRRPA